MTILSLCGGNKKIRSNDLWLHLELDDVLQNLALALANYSFVLVRLQNVHNTYEHA